MIDHKLVEDKPTLSPDKKYIYYGYYPNKVVKNSALVDKLKNSMVSGN